jgi:hypothetical protein
MERLERFKTEKKYKIVYKTFVARQLIKLGHIVRDIKPDKENPQKTLFIFEETEEFKKDLATVIGR